MYKKERRKENRVDKKTTYQHRRAAKGYTATPHHIPDICNNNKKSRKSSKQEENNIQRGRERGEEGGGGGSRSTVTHSSALGGLPYYNMVCLLDVRQMKTTANILAGSISRLIMLVDFYCQYIMSQCPSPRYPYYIIR